MEVIKHAVELGKSKLHIQCQYLGPFRGSTDQGNTQDLFWGLVVVFQEKSGCLWG